MAKLRWFRTNDCRIGPSPTGQAPREESETPEEATNDGTNIERKRQSLHFSVNWSRYTPSLIASLLTFQGFQGSQ